jgi:glycosyltransferase involved in cell wall biosynthesis
MVDKLKICVYSQNVPGVFSGGRYHSLLLAEALSLRGHETHYVTNALPVFYDEMSDYEGHNNLKVTITRDFLFEGAGDGYDVVFVTPGKTDAPLYYNSARMTALLSGANLYLINFESGNWFNSLAPEARPLEDWNHWRKSLEHGGTVLSSAQESDSWAKNFYTDYPLNTRFSVWSPPINSAVADSTKFPTDGKRKRALIISRLSDPHKGLASIIELIPDNMAGWTLVVVVGQQGLVPVFVEELQAFCDLKGVGLEFLKQPTDFQKFEELKRSSILIFPSLFEGYGYPPIEAIYCNVEVVCYDLPVIRETCGDVPHYARHGSKEDFRNVLSQLIDEPFIGTRDLQKKVYQIGQMEHAADRLEAILYKGIRENKAIKIGRRRAASFAVNVFLTNLKGMLLISFRNFKHDLRALKTTAKNILNHSGHLVAVVLNRSGVTRGLRKVPELMGLFGPLPTKHAVSRCTVDSLGVILIRGWRLGLGEVDRAEVHLSTGEVIDGTIGISRPDVNRKYPRYANRDPGFEFHSRIKLSELHSRDIRILFYNRDEILDETSIELKADNSKASYRVGTGSVVSPTMDGETVSIIARAADMLPGAPHQVKFVNLVEALRASGKKVVLVLHANPPDYIEHKTWLTSTVDELTVADYTKRKYRSDPQNGLRFSHGGVIDAINDLQNRLSVAAVISFGEDFLDELSSASEVSIRAVYLFKTSTISLESSPANHVLSSSVTLLSSELQSIVGVNPILVSATSSGSRVFAKSAASATDIIIPSQMPPECDDCVLSFISALSILDNTYTVKVLGALGARLALRQRNFPTEALPVFVDLMQNVPDIKQVYENAAIAIIPCRSENVDFGTTEPALNEANYYGRIVALNAPVKLGVLAKGNVSCESSEELAQKAIWLVENASNRNCREGHLLSYGRPKSADVELINAFKCTGVDPKDTKKNGVSLPIRVAVESLLGATSAFGSDTRLRLLLGADLSVAQSLLAGLKRRNIDVVGVCSSSPESLGREFEGFKIDWFQPAPSQSSHLLIASIDSDEILALSNKMHRMHIEHVALLQVPTIDDEQSTVSLYQSHPNSDATIFLPEGQFGSLLESKSDNEVWICTIECFRDLAPKSFYQQVDFVIVPSSSASHLGDDFFRLLDESTIVLVESSQDGCGARRHGNVVVYSSSDPIWKIAEYDELKATEIGRAESAGVIDAILLARWIGARTIANMPPHLGLKEDWPQTQADLMHNGTHAASQQRGREEAE